MGDGSIADGDRPGVASTPVVVYAFAYRALHDLRHVDAHFHGTLPVCSKVETPAHAELFMHKFPLPQALSIILFFRAVKAVFRGVCPEVGLIRITPFSLEPLSRKRYTEPSFFLIGVKL
jgi:hypothetical protein